jgi:hypothetical protein
MMKQLVSDSDRKWKLSVSNDMKYSNEEKGEENWKQLVEIKEETS